MAGPRRQNFVVYHYFDKDGLYRDNLAHFLLFGLFDSLDYLFVVQGNSRFPEISLPNVSVLRVPNRGLDFGGLSAAIQQGCVPLDRARYFFVNSSVRGPYTPNWTFGEWDRAFTPLFDIGLDLVGVTAHTGSSQFGLTVPPHIQSASYALTGKALVALIDDDFFRQKISEEKNLIVEQYEIGLSQRLTAMGFKTGSLALSQIREAGGLQPNPSSRDGDPNYRWGYFGRSADPFHVVFPKVNRKIYLLSTLDKVATTLEISELGFGLQSHPLVNGYLRRISRRRKSRVWSSRFLRKNWDMAHRVVRFAQRLVREHNQTP